MTPAEFHLELDNILELNPGTIQGGEALESLSAWDSLAVLSFIAMVDEKLKTQVSGKDIANCATVSDIAALLGDKIGN